MNLKQLQSINLSEHFRASEIFYSRGSQIITLGENEKLQRIQFFLAERLCEELLEPIREIAVMKDREAYMDISGGCRNRQSHLNMYSTNWILPSTTSDHSFMNDYYPLGVGAVDFDISSFAGNETKMKNLFYDIIETFDGRQYGQVIFYPDSNSKYIHISNPKIILKEVGELIEILPIKKKAIFKKIGEKGIYDYVRQNT